MKRFLITQPMIHGLNGSTLVTLELAEYLQGLGNEVVVYTYFLDEPAKDFFDSKKINVVADSNTELRLKDFDYIWVHSQVLPISIIKDLGALTRKTTLPVFIFHHMSAHDWIPDERPYIFDLEENIASASSFIAQETLESQEEYHTGKVPVVFFPNPAPEAYSLSSGRSKRDVKKVLIVTNHPPEELVEARGILEAKDIVVDAFGQNSEKYSLITPEIISKYDVVISIGKTVQYCLTAGVPVYVYDYFGGKGYLSGENIDAAAAKNFSGRDGDHKTAQVIADEIIEGYADALKYQSINRQAFIDKYSIDKVFPRFIKKVQPRMFEKLPKRYVNSLISAQMFAKIRFEVAGKEWNNYRRVNSLELEKTELQKELAQIGARLNKAEESIHQIRNSESFKVGSVVLRPIILAKHFIKKVRRS